MDLPPNYRYGVPHHFESWTENVIFPWSNSIFVKQTSVKWINVGRMILAPIRFIAWYVKEGDRVLSPLRIINDRGNGGGGDGGEEWNGNGVGGPEEESDLGVVED